MGGTSRPNVDSLTNLLALDPDVHNGGPLSVHGRREWSEAYGFLVPKHVPSPGLWPVWIRQRFQVFLLDNGRYYVPSGL